MSLRALMLIVLVGGGLLGWKARRVSTQRRAVATIRASGGSVWYEHQVGPDGTPDPKVAPPAPKWLRRLVGDEPFQEVAGVFLNDHWNLVQPAVVDAYLALDRAETLNLGSVWLADAQAGRIAQAPHLKKFGCDPAIVGHAGFEQICWRADLEEFSFEVHMASSTHGYSSRLPTGQKIHRKFSGRDLITASRVAPIRSLVHLKRLRIDDGNNATHKGPEDQSYLPHVAALRQLESLEIWRRSIGDDDLRLLAPLARLEHLRINGSRVTDDGLAPAAGWPRLRSLSFWIHHFERHRHASRHQAGTPSLTDAGLAHLAGCRRLEELSLVGARFGDAGMDVLAGLPALRELRLDGVEATPAALGRLLASHRFERLTLMGSGVDDRVAPLLAGQVALKELALIGPGLTDVVAPGLARLPALESLTLTGSKLTDAGLAALAASPAPLGMIDARGSAATPAGAAAFRAAHPKAQIETGPDDKSW